MPSIKAIEVRLPVADVVRSAEFFASTLGCEISTLWPQPVPGFAILKRDGLRLQLGKDETAGSGLNGSATLWLDVEELVALHAKIKAQTGIEWGPEVYFYGRREFGFRDPDGNLVIVSEVTTDPPTCTDA